MILIWSVPCVRHTAFQSPTLYHSNVRNYASKCRFSTISTAVASPAQSPGSMPCATWRWKTTVPSSRVQVHEATLTRLLKCSHNNLIRHLTELTPRSMLTVPSRLFRQRRQPHSVIGEMCLVIAEVIDVKSGNGSFPPFGSGAHRLSPE